MRSSNSRGQEGRNWSFDQRRSREYDSGSSSRPAAASSTPAASPRDPLKADGWVPTATATAQRARAAEKQDYGECGQLNVSRTRSQDQLNVIQDEEEADQDQDESIFLPSCRPMSIKTLIVGLRVLETRQSTRPLVLSVDSMGLWFDLDTRDRGSTELAMGLFHVPWLAISRVWATPEPEEAMFCFTLHRMSPISMLLEETYAVVDTYKATDNRPAKDGRAIITVNLDLREGTGPSISPRAVKCYKHGSVALTRPADMTLIVPDIFNDASIARPSKPPLSTALVILPLRRAIIGTRAFIPHAHRPDNPRALEGLHIKSSRPLRLVREKAKYAASRDRKDAGVDDLGMIMLCIQELSSNQEDADPESGGWDTLLAMAEEDIEYAEHAPASQPCSLSLTLRERSYPLKHVKHQHTNPAYQNRRSRTERAGQDDLRRIVLDVEAMPRLAPRPHVVCDPVDRFPPGFKPALVKDFDRTRFDRERYEWLCGVLKSRVSEDL